MAEMRRDDELTNPAQAPHPGSGGKKGWRAERTMAAVWSLDWSACLSSASASGILRRPLRPRRRLPSNRVRTPSLRRHG